MKKLNEYEAIEKLFGGLKKPAPVKTIYPTIEEFGLKIARDLMAAKNKSDIVFDRVVKNNMGQRARVRIFVDIV